MRSAPRHASSVGGLLAAALTVETYLYIDKCTTYEYRYTSHLRERERETKKKLDGRKAYKFQITSDPHFYRPSQRKAKKIG